MNHSSSQRIVTGIVTRESLKFLLRIRSRRETGVLDFPASRHFSQSCDLAMLLPNAMQTYLLHTMPSRRRSPDVRLAVLISFAVGLLIGVPLTFAALLLCSPTDDAFQLSEVTPALGYQRAIRRASSTLRGHPTVRLTSIRKSGLEAPTLSVPSSGRRSGAGSSVHGRNASRQQTTVSNETAPGVKRFVDGIFWTEHSESLVPKGFGESNIRQWRRLLNSTDVLRVEEGCGRMQNRMVTLSTGSTTCCRYRHNNDQIQGEIFSFYLSRLLGIENLPPSALVLADPRNPQWSAAASQMALAGWSPERPAVLTQFVPGLQPAFIPKHLRDSKSRRMHPGDILPSDVPELVQWSDLLIFDYLTANLDRVVNNMYNERWNPSMMSEPTHNLARTPTGLLLFLDNESGLLHGYRLLEKYERFHRSLLDAVCVFRRRTVRTLQNLHHRGDVEKLLKKSFVSRDPGMSDWLPFLPDRTVRILKDRIAQVLRQVEACRSRFKAS